MKFILKVVVPCVILVALAVVLWPDFAKHEDVFGDEGLLKVQADQLGRTQVSPHLEAPLDQATSVLWCGTFQLAWNEACSLIGEDLHFSGQEPEAVGFLNKKAFTKKEIDEPSYVAVADFVRNGIHAKIRAELHRKFGSRAAPASLPSIADAPRPQDIVAYAYLFKNLEFEQAFERLDSPIVFGGTRVSCFGIGKEYKQAHWPLYEQVLVLDYNDRDDFVIELKTKSEGDRVILAKVRANETLLATVASVLDRMARSEPSEAQEGDVLKVPKFNFDINRRFGELEGLRLSVSNPQVAKDLVIVSAVQNIRFQMNEQGVRLRSDSHISIGCAGQPDPASIRVMVFDKPFLVMLQRVNGKVPYFALWVDSAELLVAAP